MHVNPGVLFFSPWNISEHMMRECSWGHAKFQKANEMTNAIF